MRIALESDVSFLAEKLAQIPGVEVVVLPAPDQMNGTIEVDALLGSPVSHQHLHKIIDYCQGLKWIHILGTGVNTYPLELVKDKLITCSRGATAVPIAEWVLAMILAFEKQLPSRWINEPPEAWYMADLGCLEGKTLGIIGYGAIGQAVAKRALAFDMNVIAKVRTHRDSPDPQVKFERDLATLLSQTDHLVLALPSTPESRHLIDVEALKLMRPDAHLINVSRADLIDQDALRECLDNKCIGCASLDTVSPEPLPKGHWMYSYTRVRLSPHISWSSPTSHKRVVAPFIANVKLFLEGRSLLGVVDTEAGY